MIHTRISIEPELFTVLQSLAKEEHRSLSAVMSDALRLYTQTIRHPKPQGIGRHHSGRSDVSEQTETLLREAAQGARHGSHR